mmetsp:Transcript_4144/g.12683  ORF Transcript_4144/g.12683 Transcript_4144/m.12683 type:complete len:168 (+) Transcript_4144:365-868(+)
MLHISSVQTPLAPSQVSEYHGVSEHFQKEWQTAKDVAEPGRPEDRLALMQRHSGEMDPANQFIPMKSKPIRWEPHVDEEVRAAYRMAAEKAIAYSDSSASQARGSGVVDVLQEQLEAERQRAAIVQEKLEAALREAQELSMRAARAEAKLEMTEAMMEKMASKSRAK